MKKDKMQETYLFLSYVHQDRPIAIAFADALNNVGLEVWSDFSNLSAGVNWNHAITNALTNAAGIVVIVTKQSSRSDWVMHEIGMAGALDKGIFPIVIGDWSNMPTSLKKYQGLLLSAAPTDDEFVRAARQIAHAIAGRARQHSPSRAKFEDLSDELVREAKAINERPTDTKEGAQPPDSIFLVHGHDEKVLEEVKLYIIELGIKPVVLREVGGGDLSLLQRFFRVAADARFAVVILSADDLGAGRFQYEVPHIGEKSLQFRARQNVILELGFFYGQLGWDHVFVLLKRPDEVFPNFEMPSDISGAVYDQIDKSGRWKPELREKLKKAGFQLSQLTDLN